MNDGNNTSKEAGDTQTLLVSSLASTAAFGGAELAMRNYLSTYHLWGSAQFAVLAGQLEKKWDKNHSTELIFKHRSYVVGSILLCVAYIEATLNEVWADIATGHIEKSNTSDKRMLTADIQSELTLKWNDEKTKKMSTLDKYQVVLQTAQKTQFPRGEDPYQSVVALIKLRNALSHYVPETLKLEPFTKLGSEAETDHKRLAQDLRGYIKEAHNPFFLPNNPPFPDLFLSYGCAQWGVNSSYAFTSYFHAQLGIAPRPMPIPLPSAHSDE
jgi:hypothetical protein